MSIPSPTMTGNIFATPLRNDTEQFFVQVLQSANTVPEIDASGSFWGTDSVDDIFEGIVDGRDSLELSVLRFNPFLSTPVGPLVNGTLEFLRPGNILNGVLPEGSNLTLLAGIYTSDGSIVVDGELSIDPGVVVQMGKGASISVGKGRLSALGTVDEPIRFERSTNEQWGQIKVAPNISSDMNVLMENVFISGAGTASGTGSTPVAALDTERGGEYRNLTISECLGGGVRVRGNGGSFLFDGLQSFDTTTSVSYHNIFLSGTADVTIWNSFLSSAGSSEIYATNSIRLYVDHVELRPALTSSKGLNLRNVSISQSKRLIYFLRIAKLFSLLLAVFLPTLRVLPTSIVLHSTRRW